MGRRAWYRALERGDLISVAPGVGALVGAPATTERRILAAVLALGRPAMASHCSAAFLWGAELAPCDLVDVTIADRKRAMVVPGVRLHRPTDLDDLHPIRRRGVPTTNPLRVLVDLGQVAPGQVRVALAHFIDLGVVNRAAVAAALIRHARKGRHGVVALRRALEEWAIDDRPPDSELELAMLRLLRSHGLPIPSFHARILGFEVDFAFELERVILECDGWGTHGRDPAQFERDRRRDAQLVAAGWVVLRFTWSQITHRPTWVAAMVEQVLRARRPGFSAS
jgi:very-short-patch-repair endonuclease